MMAHAASCACTLCAEIRDSAFPTRQSDRDALADAWEMWIGTADGEVRALRMGHAGNPGSLRWVALQAIAATRVACTIDAAVANELHPIGAA